ncbi:hypothetical protein FQN53_003004 [Emmonsiellopsis sp. PD_33]|nr:hypothetical protein FQN53_003004 [Emmonsiellopsis sp. PD_33]
MDFDEDMSNFNLLNNQPVYPDNSFVNNMMMESLANRSHFEEGFFTSVYDEFAESTNDENPVFEYKAGEEDLSEPVDALGGEATVNTSNFPAATDSLTVTPPSELSNSRDSDTDLARIGPAAKPEATVQHSTGGAAPSFPSPPHAVCGSTISPALLQKAASPVSEPTISPSLLQNPASPVPQHTFSPSPQQNPTSPVFPQEDTQYTSSGAVNLDFFQLDAIPSNPDREMKQKSEFRSRSATTGAVSDAATSQNHAHRHTYPPPTATPISLYHELPSTLHRPVEVQEQDATPSMGHDEPDPELHFSSLEEANTWRAFETQVEYDSTIPRTMEEKKKIVAEMLKAMKSIKYAEDNEGMIRPFREQKHNPIRMEIDACIGRHENGPLLAIYDAKCKNTGLIPTFKERMESIVDCLWTQKTICKHLLDPFYTYTFVDDPVGAKNRVVANKNLNKRKGEVMNAGKQALGHSRSNSKSTPAKRESDVGDGLCTPFSTPRRELPTKSSTPSTINANVQNMTLNSSPLVQPHSVGFSSPAMTSTPDRGSNYNDSGNFPVAMHNQLLNSSSSHFFGPGPMANRGMLGNPSGFVRSQSTNAIQGLGQNNQFNPYSREDIAGQFGQYLPHQTEQSSYRSPPTTASRRRTIGPNPHPWATASMASISSPAHRNSELAYGHSRKRSQDESDGSEYFPSPQKKTHR